MKRLAIYLICFLAITTPSIASANWPCWRGPEYNGSNPSGEYPVKWDMESSEVVWKAEIPGKGFSTPIVWDNKIYLTTGTDGLDTVLALDWSGKSIWKKQLGAEVAGKHANASGCNPSAATDGAAVFVLFKSGSFAGIDVNGTIRWQMNLFERYGKDNRYWDFGTSPVLTDKYVVVAEMHDGKSWLAAFDKVTGQLIWKVDRTYTTPREGSQGYTTPIVFSHNGMEALLVWGGHHLTAHDAADGKIIWSCGDFNPEGKELWPSAASPVICGQVAVVPCGRADRQQPYLHGIKLGSSGDVTKTHRLWKRDDTSSFVPTPAAYKGRVYVISDIGQINCIDPLTGQDIWSGVFPKGNGKFYASPLIAGGRLYAAREDGTVFVVGLNEQFEILSQIDMKDKIIASPIAVSDRLFIRTNRHLYCIGKSGEGSSK